MFLMTSCPLFEPEGLNLKENLECSRSTVKTHVHYRAWIPAEYNTAAVIAALSQLSLATPGRVV